MRHNAQRTVVELRNGDSIVCRSKYEADVVRGVDATDGVSIGYETSRFLYEVPRLYTPDVTVTRADGSLLYIEAKGYFAADDRRKLKEVKKANPDIDLRVLFQNPGAKISKRPGALTYAQWAERAGIPWAKGPDVPAHWLRGEERHNG